MLSDLEIIEGLNEERVIWCGDFNAHNTIWGGTMNDANGMVIETLMDLNNLLCINDGDYTGMK